MEILSTEIFVLSCSSLKIWVKQKNLYLTFWVMTVQGFGWCSRSREGMSTVM